MWDINEKLYMDVSDVERKEKWNALQLIKCILCT